MRNFRGPLAEQLSGPILLWNCGSGKRRVCQFAYLTAAFAIKKLCQWNCDIQVLGPWLLSRHSAKVLQIPSFYFISRPSLLIQAGEQLAKVSVFEFRAGPPQKNWRGHLDSVSLIYLDVPSFHIPHPLFLFVCFLGWLFFCFYFVFEGLRWRAFRL